MGDSEEKLAQKARARASALEGVRVSAGRGSKRIENIDIAKPSTPPPKPNAPNSPAVATPKLVWDIQTNNWVTR